MPKMSGSLWKTSCHKPASAGFVVISFPKSAHSGCPWCGHGDDLLQGRLAGTIVNDNWASEVNVAHDVAGNLNDAIRNRRRIH